MQPVIQRMEAKGEAFSIEYPYCTEFIVSPCKLKAKEVRTVLSSWGESMIVAEGDNLIKVHIHAQRPGHVLDMAANWGTLHDIKCDNMMDQFNKNREMSLHREKKPLGMLAVVSGKGWESLMKNLGCDIVRGGQTMNPPYRSFQRRLRTAVRISISFFPIIKHYSCRPAGAEDHG